MNKKAIFFLKKKGEKKSKKLKKLKKLKIKIF